MSTRDKVYKLIDSLNEEKLQALLLLFGGESNFDNENDSEVDALMGYFSECADPNLIPLEKKAWERAVIEKYENT